LDCTYEATSVPMCRESDFRLTPFALPHGRSSPSSMSDCEGSTNQMYGSLPAVRQTVPLTYFNLQGMDQNASPPGYTGHSMFRSHSDSVLPGYPTGRPSQTSNSANPCSPLTGQTSQGTAQPCDRDIDCLDFPTYHGIEEYSLMPHMLQESSKSPNTSRTYPPALLASSDGGSTCSSTSQPPSPWGNSQRRSQRPKADDADAKSLSKKAHCLVERRYRENLNGKFVQLRQVLSEAKRNSQATQQARGEGPEAKGSSFSKFRKTDVIVEAVEYVQQTEVDLRHMTDEIWRLRTRLAQLEGPVDCDDCLLAQDLFGL